MIRVIPWDGDRVAWDAAVAADPDGRVEHLAAWHSIVTTALGHECWYLVAVEDDGAIAGVLPLARVRSRLFGDYLVSMPFLNVGGPLGTETARFALVGAAVDLAREQGVDLLELRTPEAPAAVLVVSQRKITHHLALPATPDELWGKLPPKVRNQIRRPAKDGLTARIGSSEIAAFYEVFARHMRTLGTPVMPRVWFDAIATYLPRELVVVTVHDGDVPVAGGLGFCHRGRCEITWASARREWARSAPNMLLYWTFLQEAIARGATRFDFGRCTPGSATHAFKRQWGGEDVPLAWGQWRAGHVTATPSPERPLYRVASACWRRLPLVVTNTLGPPLARALP